jgi:curved DNA-binding protein CbpA
LSEAQKRTPKPAPARLDPKSFPLSPTDGYVLSRIDGTLNEADLTASTGLPDEAVKTSLAKLESLGLIVFEGTLAPVGPPSGASPIAGRTSSVQIRAAVPIPPMSRPSVSNVNITPPATATTQAPPVVPAKPAPQPPAPSRPQLGDDEQVMLAEDVDLEPELRLRVLDVYRDLERRDFYKLLGVEEGVDRKAIKRAYYELAAAFHPDRYFRKRLGSFKVRMEVVFARITLAHDTLSDKQRRGEYNAYLSEQRIALAIEENLALGVSQAQQAEESLERLVAAGAEAPMASVAPVGPAPSAPPPVIPSFVPPDLAGNPRIDVGARRDALARRLLGGRTTSSSGMKAAAPVAPTLTSTPTPKPMATADAVAALKRRYEDRMTLAKASEARKFAGQGATALAAGDLVAAANAYRIASNLTPDDADLGRKYSQVKAKADVLLSDTYTKQAHYEETNGQWTDAARSWARVCKVTPDDPNAHERAANAVFKAKGDMHDAVRFAQRACTLSPQNAHYRVTLASCYVAAGLALNAKRELDTAAQLAPHDDTIQAMIKRVVLPSSSSS